MQIWICILFRWAVNGVPTKNHWYFLSISLNSIKLFFQVENQHHTPLPASFPRRNNFHPRTITLSYSSGFYNGMNWLLCLSAFLLCSILLDYIKRNLIALPKLGHPIFFKLIPFNFILYFSAKIFAPFLRIQFSFLFVLI